MSPIKSKTTRGMLATLLGLVVLAATPALPAAGAAPAAGWQIASSSNTTVDPGDELTYFVDLANRTEAESSGPYTVTTTLPGGLTAVSAGDANPFVGLGFDCGSVLGMSTIECTTGYAAYPDLIEELAITVAVDPDAAGVKTAGFEVSGGGLTNAATADPVTVSAAPPVFGIDAFDTRLTEADGAPSTQAAEHPYLYSTVIDLNTATDPSPTGNPFDPALTVGPHQPVEPVKDIAVELPPGLVGNPSHAARCTSAELANSQGANALSLCPPESQVGTVTLMINGGRLGNLLGPIPLFNMAPPPGAPARFGFNAAGILISIDTSVRSDSDYGLTATSRNTSEGLPIVGSVVDFWGVPAAPDHGAERACPGTGGAGLPGNGSCSTTSAPAAFFRNPTSCGSSMATTANASSWFHPDTYDSRTSYMHEGPGYPYAPEDWGARIGFDGCDQVPFEPSLTVAATTQAADSPTGLIVDASIPQGCWEEKASAEEAEEAICQADLKDAMVKLPAGMSLNPAAANGRSACSPAEVGLTTPLGATPIHFDKTRISCPEASKLGTVEIETPLLDHSLQGGLYLAAQRANPFKSLLALYLVVEDPQTGTTIKLAGHVVADERSGQLATSFDENPQLPFSNLHLRLFGGPRAALRTPAACGAYATKATLAPWSGNPPVNLTSSFQITQGCGGGFDPKLSAGTRTPTAGAYSPFDLRLTRADASQELGALRVTLPPGLVGSLRGYSYCPDSVLAAISGAPGAGRGEEASPSCPASSRVGSATVGAGAGPSPFYTDSGRAYIAGPYKGAPVSLAVVAPAVAGPFDLGTVVVRNAIRIDPTTAQLTVDSDPLPSILHGIPLDLRDVRVQYDKTVNPTSCEPMSFASTVTSTQGATASPSAYFQAAGCDRLGFGPRLSLRLFGPTHRAAHPALRAVLRTRPGDANIGKATVILPRTELLENAHIRTICTRVQFDAGPGGGAECPKGSVYGHARAWTPLLDRPLQGPVYLRANGGQRELPDLVAALDGQIHVDLVGYIDSVNERIRTRFLTAPDAPVSKFELRMQGRGKGLLANNTELCRAKPRASAFFEGHNNRLVERQPPVRVGCGGGRRSR